MIYLDNAATGGFKPRTVVETTESIIRFLSANPGRSGHRLAVTGAEIVYDCRKALADFFEGIPERTIFTKNCTEALNLAIFGSVKKGGHVITTVYEHNSVLRPLYHLEKNGIITLDLISPEGDVPLASLIEKKIKPETYLIVSTAVSNVSGEALPVNEIAAIAKKHNLLYLCDGAQGGGHVPLSLSSGISMLALAGHKGLYGIMGSGALLFDKSVELSPIIFGGTGTESFSPYQPECYPEKLESGTIALPAVAGLLEGVKYAQSNFLHFSEHLIKQTALFISAVSQIKNVKCYSSPNPAGIVSFSIGEIPSGEIADRLNSEYDIAVRGGLHCAPKMHEFLKTEKNGLVRISIAAQNSTRELYYAIKAVSEIAKG